MRPFEQASVLAGHSPSATRRTARRQDRNERCHYRRGIYRVVDDALPPPARTQTKRRRPRTRRCRLRWQRPKRRHHQPLPRSLARTRCGAFRGKKKPACWPDSDFKTSRNWPRSPVMNVTLSGPASSMLRLPLPGRGLPGDGTWSVPERRRWTNLRRPPKRQGSASLQF